MRLGVLRPLNTKLVDVNEQELLKHLDILTFVWSSSNVQRAVTCRVIKAGRVLSNV